MDVGKEEERSRTTSSCLARGAECCSHSDAVSSVEEFKGKNHLEAEFKCVRRTDIGDTLSLKLR